MYQAMQNSERTTNKIVKYLDRRWLMHASKRIFRIASITVNSIVHP